MFCSKCGKENKEDAKFCVNCGSSLNQSVPKTMPTPSGLLSIVAAIIWIASIFALIGVVLVFILDSESFGVGSVVIGVVAALALWWSHGKVMTHTRAQKAQVEANLKAYTNLIPTSQGKRLLNLILDLIGVYIFALIVGFALGYLGLSALITSTDDTLLGWIVFLAYYLVFEGIWGKSPAKWITGTKVVMNDGSKPPFKNILGRSFARLIPFEFFSLVSSSNPVGWHDKLSKTVVVDD